MDVFELPEGYSEIKRIDLLKNKKTAVLVNLGALIIALGLFFVGITIVPISLKSGVRIYGCF